MLGCNCQHQQNMGDLGFAFDPITAIASAVGGVFGIGQTILATKGQKEILKQEGKAATKAAKDAAEAAKLNQKYQMEQFKAQSELLQAQSYSDAAMQKRNQEIMALIAVGGVALLISGFFVYGAVKSKR